MRRKVIPQGECCRVKAQDGGRGQCAARSGRSDEADMQQAAIAPERTLATPTVQTAIDAGHAERVMASI